MNDQLRNNIIQRIKHDELTPEKRWRVVVRRLLIWVPAILSFIVGSLATGVILFRMLHAGWELQSVTHDTYGAFFFDALPYAWIILVVILILTTRWALRKTHRGYRWKGSLIVLATLMLTTIVGAIVYQTGIAYTIDKELENRTREQYHSMRSNLAIDWHNPSDNRFAGEISLDAIDQNTLNIISQDGEVWNINISNALGRDEISGARQVRVFGSYVDPTTRDVEACIVVPIDIHATNEGNGNMMAMLSDSDMLMAMAEDDRYSLSRSCNKLLYDRSMTMQER